MEARLYTPEQHKILTRWWEVRGWSAIPQDFLPETGYIAWDNHTPIAAGFLYKTDSKFGLLEWLISDPTTSMEQRHQGIDTVLDAISEAAKNKGIKAIYTTTSHDRLKTRYEAHGFMKGDTNSTTYTKRVD